VEIFAVLGILSARFPDVMQKKHTQQPTHRSRDGFDQPLQRHHVGRIWNGCAWQLGPAGSQGGQSDWAGLQDAGLWYLRLKALVYVYIYYIYMYAHTYRGY
jgi:hypothetical protein